MAMYLRKAMEMPCRQVWWLFEERYKEAYDDRAYRAKGLDAPAKYAPTLEVRKGNARYRRGQQNMGRWKCQLSNTHISLKNTCTYYW